MRPLWHIALGLLAVSGLAACTSEDSLRADGLTPWAGNALAANTAMQMVDPWPAGVERTDLLVPAERKAGSPPARSGGGGSADAGMYD